MIMLSSCENMEIFLPVKAAPKLSTFGIKLKQSVPEGAPLLLSASVAKMALS